MGLHQGSLNITSGDTTADGALGNTETDLASEISKLRAPRLAHI